jgi:hypothetical protein
MCVADVFEQAMAEVMCFFKENSEEIHNALTVFNSTAKEVDRFLTNVTDNVMPTFSATLTHINDISGKINSGEGAFGQLLNSKQLYHQIDMTMARLEDVMNDLHNYGLFYQFDKGWQRERRRQAMQSRNFSHVDRVNSYFNDEIQKVSTSLKRVGRAISSKQMQKQFEADPRFEELVKQIELMEKNLQETSQTFTTMNKQLVIK